MSERIRGSYDDALYKSTFTLLYFTLRICWILDRADVFQTAVDQKLASPHTSRWAAAWSEVVVWTATGDICRRESASCDDDTCKTSTQQPLNDVVIDLHRRRCHRSTTFTPSPPGDTLRTSTERLQDILMASEWPTIRCFGRSFWKFLDRSLQDIVFFPFFHAKFSV